METLVLGFLREREDVAESLEVDENRRTPLGWLKADTAGASTARSSASTLLLEDMFSGRQTDRQTDRQASTHTQIQTQIYQVGFDHFFI